MMEHENESTAVSPRTYSFVADESTAREMARAVFRAQLTSKQFLFSYAAAPLSFVVIWLLTGSWVWIGAPLSLIAFPFGVLRALTKQCRAQMQPGIRLETEFHPTILKIRYPTVATEILLSSLRRLRTVGDYVVFQYQSNPRLYQALPRELFPEDEVARSRQDVGQLS